ncbi:MAG: osmoprotectant NAGGN system M42 family peptidase [Magnetococcales bacterium]|nr:osmoprotectant NAGGN system M42 family peptidase [Magnetococcales bacterium]
MAHIPIDQDYLLNTLNELLRIPSPSGMTDHVVERVCLELDRLDIPYELTRRGAIRAHLSCDDSCGIEKHTSRAIVAHVDTLGIMVRELKKNGRLGIVAIGHWNARFAEGARVSVIASGGRKYRGTVLPLKASGHVYNDGVDEQPSNWDNLEIRLDERSHTVQDLLRLQVHVGDTVAVDSHPEFADNGFINARHLDDKAGVAAVLAAARAARENDLPLPIPCHLLFTISEEVGVGASHIMHRDASELVSVDNGTIAPGQNTCDYGVTIAMQDSSGPFDRRLTRRLVELCRESGIEYSRDVFRFYRSDAAAALEAGNDLRTALICFALDGSHGWERTHADSLHAVARLLLAYMMTTPVSFMLRER